jgi:hypothetical protein
LDDTTVTARTSKVGTLKAHRSTVAEVIEDGIAASDIAGI